MAFIVSCDGENVRQWGCKLCRTSLGGERPDHGCIMGPSQLKGDVVRLVIWLNVSLLTPPDHNGHRKQAEQNCLSPGDSNVLCVDEALKVL